MWLLQHILAFFSLLVDKTSKYFEEKKASFYRHLIFSATVILNLFLCPAEVTQAVRTEKWNLEEEEMKSKSRFFFFPHQLLSGQADRGKRRVSGSECSQSRIFPAARALSKHCTRYSHWDKVMSKMWFIIAVPKGQSPGLEELWFLLKIRSEIWMRE